MKWLVASMMLRRGTRRSPSSHRDTSGRPCPLFVIGEEEWEVPPNETGIALHHFERRAEIGREINLGGDNLAASFSPKLVDIVDERRAGLHQSPHADSCLSRHRV